MSNILQEQQALINQTRNADDVIKVAFSHFETGRRIYERITKVAKNTLVFIVLVGGGALIALLGIYAFASASFGEGIAMILFGTLMILCWFGISYFAGSRAKPHYEAGKRVINDNLEVLSVVPSEYWFPLATEYIARLFETNRIDTMRDALNMTDTYLHRCKMENSMNSTLASYTAISKQLASIQRSSSAAATGAWVSAMNSYISNL